MAHADRRHRPTRNADGGLRGARHHRHPRRARTQAPALAARQRARELLDLRLQRQRLLARLPEVGQQVCDGLDTSAAGAASQAFAAATNTDAAPLTGYGFFRVGEDGRLYLLTKSEHYHTPLGHAFPGYALLETARRLGIPNATHNNTRGHITRLLEQELVRTANGLAPEDASGLEATLSSTQPGVLNGVLNLETGSLAAEAALKMMLARFFQSQEDVPGPLYQGRTPVFLVLGNDDGGLHANYHGTTVLTQLLRGMWPEFLQALRGQGAFEVCAVRPNHLEDLDAAFAQGDLLVGKEALDVVDEGDVEADKEDVGVPPCG